MLRTCMLLVGFSEIYSYEADTIWAPIGVVKHERNYGAERLNE